MKFNGVFLLSGMLAVCLTAVTVSAQQLPVPLGSDSTFAILAGSTVTFTGAGTVTGNIGISPGTAFVAGSPAVTVLGTVYAGGTIAAQAQADLTTAIGNASGRANPTIISGDIGGETLTPGLYSSTSTLAISIGDLTLDGQGDPNAVFIFQIASTLTMTSGRQVFLVNGANAANIFWQVGTSATLGTTTVLQGTILASASITMDTGSTLNGRALAKAGVTVDTGGGNSAIVPFGPLRYIAIQPCRVADTRNPNGNFGGPLLAAGTSRSFAIQSGACGIPNTAQAYSLNVTVVPGGPLRFLRVWPTGQLQPATSLLNSYDGRVKANAAIVAGGTAGAISVFATDNTNVVLDITGYFVTASNASALAFYPLTPCRVTDTRQSGPFLSAGQTRTFAVLTSPCGVPSNAQAYSLNFTAMPHGALTFLSAWQAGQAQPLASTLNAPTGTVTANAAIVPAGGGDIDAFATNDTDLAIDIDGYFAPPLAGGLSFYTVPPCRVLDSRLPAGAQQFSGALAVSLGD